jgi:hypothetical protein
MISYKMAHSFVWLLSPMSKFYFDKIEINYFEFSCEDINLNYYNPCRDKYDRKDKSNSRSAFEISLSLIN